MEWLDYLKSNCRSWESDCDNLSDTQELADHLQSKFNLNSKKAFSIAACWTGYAEKTREENESR